MDRKPTYEELEQRVKVLEHAEMACKKSLKLLRESEKKHKELLEGLLKEKKLSEEFINSLPGLFYVLDKNGMVRWNREWNIIGGYADSDLKGLYGTAFFEGEDQERAKEFAVRAFRDGVSNFEATFLTKNGRRIPYYFTGIKKILNGKDHIIGLGIDITERKREEREKQRLQQQLQQSYKTKAIGTLAGGIAHKFNNALCEITGNIELFKMANPNSKDIDKYMDRMLSSVSNMSNLSNQLIAYAEGGKYQPKTMSLSDVIDGTLSIVVDKRLATAIRVETDIPSDIFKIKGDQAQIQMLISAIIENAIEAIENRGRIRIILRNEVVDKGYAKPHIGIHPGAYVCLRVIDDGKGMDEETKRRIFEPFYTTNFYGRGLGMAAAYGIINNHNGWIDVDSESGRGTVVSIYLPAVDNNMQGENMERIHSYNRVGTILIIEDEEMVMSVGEAMLENMGHRVLKANNGNQAIDIIKTFKGDIDVALLDMGLPDIGGKELYPMIIAIRPELKVIVLSGYSIDGPARDVLNAGANAFIQKPFVLSDLRKTLQKVIDRRQFERFEIQGDVFISLKSLPSNLFKLMDISQGGLACLYRNKEEPISNNFTWDELVIQQDANDVLFEGIPCRIVTDQPQSDVEQSGFNDRRRCGIQFGELSPDQRGGLDTFIASIRVQ